MPMNPALLETAIKAAVFGELQSAFASAVPPEHQQQVLDQHTKMAGAVAKAAAEIITHITTFMECPAMGTGVVNATGVGTGGGVPGPVTTVDTGTAVVTIPPGGFK